MVTGWMCVSWIVAEKSAQCFKVIPGKVNRWNHKLPKSSWYLTSANLPKTSKTNILHSSFDVSWVSVFLDLVSKILCRFQLLLQLCPPVLFGLLFSWGQAGLFGAEFMFSGCLTLTAVVVCQQLCVFQLSSFLLLFFSNWSVYGLRWRHGIWRSQPKHWLQTRTAELLFLISTSSNKQYCECGIRGRNKNQLMYAGFGTSSCELLSSGCWFWFICCVSGCSRSHLHSYDSTATIKLTQTRA